MDNNLYMYPRLEACGYQWIQPPKSSCCFPAYLIAYSSTHQEYKSKRDLLRLDRTVRTINTSIPQYPKAALSILSKHAQTFGPWARPDSTIQSTSTNTFDPKMTKSIKKLDQYLQACSRHTVAWHQFKISQNQLVDSRPKPNPISNAARLGQYFCSSENLEFVSHISYFFI